MKLSALIKILTDIKENTGDLDLNLIANGKPVNEEYIMFYYGNEEGLPVTSITMDIHSDITIIN